MLNKYVAMGMRTEGPSNLSDVHTHLKPSPNHMLEMITMSKNKVVELETRFATEAEKAKQEICALRARRVLNDAEANFFEVIGNADRQKLIDTKEWLEASLLAVNVMMIKNDGTVDALQNAHDFIVDKYRSMV
jgi:hypothetical protein